MDVIVAGGGIAGLASALAIARQGHRIRVIERAERIEERGAGVQIGPNGAKALERLGVYADLEPRLWQPPAITLMDGRTGATLRRFRLAPTFAERFGAPYRVAHRSDLLAALLAAARREPSIELITGSEVAGVETAQGRPRIRLKSGVAYTADAAVGADGLHSTVRASLLGDAPPLRHRHIIYRALVRREDIAGGSGDVVLWLLAGGHVVHYPVRGGDMTNLVAVATGEWSAADWNAPVPRNEIEAAFATVAPDLKRLLAMPGQWSKWGAADRPPVAKWGSGAVTLIGDAAHPMLPYLAQGAAAALEDAVVLGRALAESRPVAESLRVYESERFRRTARLQRESRRQGRISHAAGLAATLRNLYLRVVPESLFFAPMAWIYAWEG
jgi:salicylate hydroxylase